MFKAIDFYVLSWDVPRKPACNVVEIAQRKSRELSNYETWDSYSVVQFN